jgi:hypothetical protein
MDETRFFKLRLSEGMQSIRLDDDSLDYDWKGSLSDFHGTLPYENLRMKSRVRRRKKEAGRAALICALLLPLLALLLPYSSAHYLIVFGGVIFTNLVGYFIIQHVRGRTICVQIEPRPFGFAGEFPVPDTKAGRTFLERLEEAWKESLRRRFLVHDEKMLHWINWLEGVGVLTSEEAAVERSLAETKEQPEQRLVESLN